MNEHEAVERFWIVPEDSVPLPAPLEPLTPQQRADYEILLRARANYKLPRVHILESKRD